jgi:hypothetical protein
LSLFGVHTGAFGQEQLPHEQLVLHVTVPYVLQLCCAFAVHEPSPEHWLQADHVPVVPSHVRDWLPQLPHVCEEGPVHICPVHEPHWQLPPHDSVPLFWQDVVAFGVHAPSPVHVPHADHVPVPLSHVRVCVPQLPQGCDDGPEHVWLAHVPQWQLPPHDCIPPDPQDWLGFGAHSPSPVHAPHADHVPVVLSQVRVCVPQLPHACDDAPVQGTSPHAAQVHAIVHDCVPPPSQACEAPAVHTPSAEHADQADHVPVVALHVRDCVPQLPHVCDAAPGQPPSPPEFVSAPASPPFGPESRLESPCRALSTGSA